MCCNLFRGATRRRSGELGMLHKTRSRQHFESALENSLIVLPGLNGTSFMQSARETKDAAGLAVQSAYVAAEEATDLAFEAAIDIALGAHHKAEEVRLEAGEVMLTVRRGVSHAVLGLSRIS